MIAAPARSSRNTIRATPAHCGGELCAANCVSTSRGQHAGDDLPAGRRLRSLRQSGHLHATSDDDGANRPNMCRTRVIARFTPWATRRRSRSAGRPVRGACSDPVAVQYAPQTTVQYAPQTTVQYQPALPPAPAPAPPVLRRQRRRSLPGAPVSAPSPSDARPKYDPNNPPTTSPDIRMKPTPEDPLCSTRPRRRDDGSVAASRTEFDNRTAARPVTGAIVRTRRRPKSAR